MYLTFIDNNKLTSLKVYSFIQHIFNVHLIYASTVQGSGYTIVSQ